MDGSANRREPHDVTLHDVRQLVHRRIERYLRRSPYRLFPDETVVRSLVTRLARNLVAHGRQYCPCRKVTGDRAADRPNICPCRTHRAEIARDGHCECRLFVSQEFIERRSNDKP
ncbi:MAG: ferredoxin:thioredoxin reductase [Armatimonadota bacterium]|nr:MAG: ferredoxin:thioredoxin reductase [Armatimonadota bacterium]